MFSFGNKKAERERDMKARPKLERRNAAKNIEYVASLASNPSDEPQPLRISRSLDLSPAAYSTATSFRIGGSIEEVDLLCRSLGLSGPDDFAIPVATWEASLKARSSSDLLPRSRFFDSDRWLSQPKNPISAADLPSEVVGVTDEKPDEISRLPEDTSGGNDGGMKGIRPPVLTPPPLPDSLFASSPAGSVLALPPSISVSVEDRSSSTRHVVRWFDLKDENELVNGARLLDSEVEEEEEEESVGSGVAEVLEERETSEDCSVCLSTSKDGDLSSTSTEFVISPSGRFKKMIGSWMRGQLLGSGSFGTVYEGISE